MEMMRQGFFAAPGGGPGNEGEGLLWHQMLTTRAGQGIFGLSRCGLLHPHGWAGMQSSRFVMQDYTTLWGS